jgi:hypothetical protein
MSAYLKGLLLDLMLFINEIMDNQNKKFFRFLFEIFFLILTCIMIFKLRAQVANNKIYLYQYFFLLVKYFHQLGMVQHQCLVLY